MSFGGVFGEASNDVGPVESNTPGWQTTERLNVWQAFKLGFKESFRKPGTTPTGRRLRPGRGLGRWEEEE